MSMADLPSNCGDTLNQRLQSQQNNQQQQQQRVSRSGLVYGASFSRGSCLDGVRRIQEDFYNDMWYDVERFQLDHINEVLTKLNDGSLDDEIWGKIVVMERCKRIAKAYLRKTTVIVDGGDEEFDGKTLGFNFFTNPMRDEYTKELRAKIGDGVIIKMDNQGNIKAMARGSTPIFVQGWKDSKSHCISDKVIRNHGKLITKSSTAIQNDEDRVVKIFDMRRFKQCVERDPYETDMDARNLLLKSCVRVALVKDGGANDPLKTPCWFMIINLVALDMLKTKLPTVCSNPILYAQATLNSGINETASSRLSRIMSQVSIVPPSSNNNNNADLYSNPAITHLIAAAMHQQHQQQQQHYAGNMSGKLATKSSSSINMEQIAKLASTLSLANPNLMNGSSNNYQHSSASSFRRTRRSRSFSDSDDSEIDNNNRLTAIKNATTTTTGYSGSTTGSSSGISGFGDRHHQQQQQQKRGFGADLRQQQIMAKSVDALHESRKIDSSKNGKDKYVKPTRPRLSENLFQKPIEETTGVKPWKSCASTTSDYDSNKEVFDSGSWSSNSRVSSKEEEEDEPRSYSPSIPSDIELHHHHQNNDRRNSAPHEIANAAAFIARQRHHQQQQIVRRVSSNYDSSTTPPSMSLLSPYKPVYTKRNTLPTKGSRKIRRAISRRDIDQKQPNTARAVSPKPMVQLPSIESTELPTPQRTAVCVPIQRNNIATSASDPVKFDEGSKCNGNLNNNPISDHSRIQQQQRSLSTLEQQQQQNNIPTQPNDFRDQQQQRAQRIRKESSTDSEASGVQSEIEAISAAATTAPLTRQHPIRRAAMGSQGVGVYAGGTTTTASSTKSSAAAQAATTTTPSTVNRKFNFPQSPPSIRDRTPSRTVSQSTPKYTTNQIQSQKPAQHQQQQSSENRVYDAQSLRPWKTRRESTAAVEREKITFKSQTEQQPPSTNANVMRIEQDQFTHHNGAYNPTKTGQIQNSIPSRMPRRTSSKESRNVMSNEQSSFRERAWAQQSPFNPTTTTTPTMAPTIQRWLNADKPSTNSSSNHSTRQSINMETSNSNLPSKAPTTQTTNIWRFHRNGPFDELLASKQRDKERNQQQQQFNQAIQQQQHQRRESTTNMDMETQRRSNFQQQQQQSQQQISTISNHHHHPTQQQSPPTNVRSLRNYYTELQQQKQHSWNQQQQQTLCSTTILTPPRMKRLQSQQFYRHSYHRSMDAMMLNPPKEIPPIPKLSKLLPQNPSHHQQQHQQSSNNSRFCQFPPPPPPPPPQRLASIVPPLQSNNFCIN